jgi:hypothetical protein
LGGEKGEEEKGYFFSVVEIAIIWAGRESDSSIKCWKVYVLECTIPWLSRI